MSWQATAWVLARSRARLSDRLVLLAIANYAWADGTNGFPSVERLVDDTLLSESQVRESIKALEAMGELEVERNAGRNRCNLYRIMMEKAVYGGEKKETLQNVDPPQCGPIPSTIWTLTPQNVAFDPPQYGPKLLYNSKGTVSEPKAPAEKLSKPQNPASACSAIATEFHLAPEPLSRIRTALKELTGVPGERIVSAFREWASCQPAGKRFPISAFVKDSPRWMGEENAQDAPQVDSETAMAVYVQIATISGSKVAFLASQRVSVNRSISRFGEIAVLRAFRTFWSGVDDYREKFAARDFSETVDVLAAAASETIRKERETVHQLAAAASNHQSAVDASIAAAASEVGEEFEMMQEEA